MSFRLALALFAASTTMPATAADGSDALARLRVSVAQNDMVKASEIFEETLLERLPASQTNQPDPILDRMLIEIAALCENFSALSSVTKRVVSNPIAGDGARYRLFAARAAESESDLTVAETLYQNLVNDPTLTSVERQTAQLGLVRQQAAIDPAKALNTIAGIDRSSMPKDLRWELELLDGRATAMASGDAAATTKMQLAWAHAIDADPIKAGPARIASDLAFAAARNGDRRQYLNLLALTRFSRRGDNSTSPAPNLPLCSEQGLRPDDLAIIETVQVTGVGRPSIGLVWANRPGVGATFLAAARKASLPSYVDSQISHFAMRCRTMPAADYAVLNSIEDEISHWMTGKGAYPLSRQASEEGNVLTLVGELARREVAYGRSSIMLLPVLMVIQSANDPFSGDTAAGKRAEEMAARVQEILVANDAPASLMLVWRLGTISLAVQARTKTVEQAQAEALDILSKAASDAAAPIDLIYSAALSAAEGPAVPTNMKAALLDAALKLIRRRNPASDPRARALTLRLARLRSEEGDKSTATALYTTLKLPADLCAIADPAPRFISSALTSDDYPTDLLFSSIVGTAILEFGIDAEGKAVGGRVVLADPPFAFDAITIEKGATIRYDPSAAKNCRGQIQRVVWRLPY
ncbi:hypothetical protein FHS91_000534 [Sphingobium xanthum]|uniref:hypothetical protein n=1 Tax=Sphingobium xanthum TaxID=1387165 RepID=UPI001C8BA1A2|nr:hypothetical protein [Sphingobium xanthum]